MKSRLMQSEVSPEFFDDVKRFATLPDTAFQELLSAIETYRSPAHLPTTEDLLPVAQKTGVTVNELLKSFAVALFLFSREDSNKDSISAIMEDLVSEKKIDEADAQVISRRIAASRPILAGKAEVMQKTKSDLSSTFPVLSHLHTRCSITTRYGPQFEALKDSPETYKPVITALIPVAVVQLDVDSYDDIHRFAFALSETELQEMINSLQLTLVQLRELSRILPKRG